MNVRDGYNNKKVNTFDMQDRLDEKIDKLTSMMSKLTAQGNNQNKLFKPKIFQGKRRGQKEIIMIKVIIKIDPDQIVETGECHIGVGLNTDRTIEEGHNILTIIEMTLGEETLEKPKIIEVKILEVDIEVTIEMKTLEEVEVDLEKDNIQEILEGMIRAIVVGHDQVSEPVLIGIQLDVLNVGSMIIVLKTV